MAGMETEGRAARGDETAETEVKESRRASCF